MFRWLAFCVLLCAGAFALVTYAVGHNGLSGITGTDPGAGGGTNGAEIDTRPAPPPGGMPKARVAKPGGTAAPGQAQAIEGGILQPVFYQEVPSERDGRLMAVGTEVSLTDAQIAQLPADERARHIKATYAYLVVEVGPRDRVTADQRLSFPGDTKVYRRWQKGEPLPPGKVKVAGEPKVYKLLQMGDEVKAGQVLALVNPAIPVDDLNVKVTALTAAEADRLAAIETKLEAERRYRRDEGLYNGGGGGGGGRVNTISRDEVEQSRLTWNRYIQEEASKTAAVAKAQVEVNSALTIVGQCEIRSSINGTVKNIYKQSGEAVKNLESVLQVQNPNRLRVEVMVDAQETGALREGSEVVVEAAREDPPARSLLYGQEVACVAVSARGKHRTIIAGSPTEAGLHAWDADTWQTLWQLPVPVRSAACSPAAAKENLLLFGCPDGNAYLLDLDKPGDDPLKLEGGHDRKALLAVAFSPDGRLCATAGEDRAICLWDAATRERLDKVSPAHRGWVTSLQFTPDGKLVSAGRDKRLLVWTVQEGKRLAPGPVEFRTDGEVPVLGSDGRSVVVDQNKSLEIRLYGIADRSIEGVIRNRDGGGTFSTLALPSPDGKTVLTNVGTEARLQLWRSPAGRPRAAELRQYVYNGGSATCGTFSPDGAFAVTGTQDGSVLVWALPAAEEVDRPLKARVTLVEKSRETQSRKVRVWAELNNPGWLIPGARATLVVR